MLELTQKQIAAIKEKFGYKVHPFVKEGHYLPAIDGERNGKYYFIADGNYIDYESGEMMRYNEVPLH